MVDDVLDMLHHRGPALIAFGHQLTRSSTEAHDLVQEAVARILTSQRRSPGRIDDIEAYTRTVMVRALIDNRRRGHGVTDRTDALTEIHDRAEEAVGFDVRLVDRDQLWTAIGKLPLRQRTVLVLRYYQDATDLEIAADLDCPSGTVRSLASRALFTLRAQLTRTASHPQESP